MTLKKIIFLALVVSTRTVFSQSDFIYFSSTGDTVLQTYSYYLIHEKDTSFIYHILRKHPVDTVQVLSYFSLPAGQKLNPYENLNVDTIKKYHLTFESIPIEPYTSSEFDISARHTRIKTVGKTESYEAKKFIYKTHVMVKIKCKDQIIYSRKINYMFKANSPDEFDNAELMPTINAWKMNNKYFIRYSIRDEQTVKKEKSEVSYTIHSYYAFVN